MPFRFRNLCITFPPIIPQHFNETFSLSNVPNFLLGPKLTPAMTRGLHGPVPYFSNRPDQQLRDDFSNGPGRAGKKRNEFLNGRIWLQKRKMHNLTSQSGLTKQRRSFETDR